MNRNIFYHWLRLIIALAVLLGSSAAGGAPIAFGEPASPSFTPYQPNMGDGYALWRTLWYGRGDLFEVFFLDDQRGWVVGTAGRIFRTVNGGQSWHMTQWRPHRDRHLSREVGPDLYDIFFVSPREGWAVGKDGVIIHTVDGGDTWVGQDSGVTLSLNAVAFAPDGKTGWAVGNEGVVRHTTDGGKTWSPQPSGIANHLYDIFVLDAQRAWAVGENGHIIATTNGGQTWTIQRAGGAHLNAILFLPDGQTGWAVGDIGYVWKTTDGGATWTRENVGSNRSFYDIVLDEDGNLWVSGSYGTLGRRSPDGTWQFWTVDTSVHLKGLALTNKIWLVAQKMTLLAAETPDGPWHNPLGGQLTFLGGIAMPDGVHGWAVGRRENVPRGKEGVILRTEDGGWSWYAQETGVYNSYWNDVAAVDANTAWVVGQDIDRNRKNVVHTTDGGQTWTEQLVGLSNELMDIDCADANRCWVVVRTNPGDAPILAYTTDGGATWTLRYMGSDFIYDVRLTAVDVEPDGRAMLFNLAGELLFSDDFFQTTTHSAFPATNHGQWDVDQVSPELTFTGGLFGQIVRMLRTEYMPTLPWGDPRRCAVADGFQYCQLKGGGAADTLEWFGVGAITDRYVLAVGGMCLYRRPEGPKYVCREFDEGVFGYTDRSFQIGTWSKDPMPVGTPGRLRDLIVFREGQPRGVVDAPTPYWDAIAVGDGGFILGYKREPNVLFSYPIDPAPNVDGRFTEWAPTPGVNVNRWNADRVSFAPPDSLEDLSARVQARYHGDTLYLSVWVTDSVRISDDGLPLQDDGVRIAIDAAHNGEPGGVDDVVIWVGADGTTQVDARYPTVLQAAAVVTTTNGYQVEMALNAAAMGMALSSHPTWGFSFEVWDDDNGGPVDHVLGSDGPTAGESHFDMADLVILGPQIVIQNDEARWAKSESTYICTGQDQDRTGNTVNCRTMNYAYTGRVQVGPYNSRATLLRFDLSPLAPSMVIQQAELQLTTTQFSSNGTLPVSVHRLLRAWSMDEATWENATRDEPWQVAGALGSQDYDPTPEWTTNVTGPSTTFTWDITQVVRDWVAGVQPNYGVILRSTQNGVPHGFYPSNSHPVLGTYRPRLRISYVIPWPESTPPPTYTPTPTPTSPPDATPTPTPTATFTPSSTPTSTPTPTETPTPTPTSTPTFTPTPSQTPTPVTPSPTPTPTLTPLPSPTPTPTVQVSTPTATPTPTLTPTPAMNAILRGVVWEDRDLDKVVDVGEPRLGGVRVELWRKGMLIRVANTLSDGSYRFSFLPAGTYTLVEQDPAGYMSLTPNRVEVVLATSETLVVNFGDVPEGYARFIYIPNIER